MNRTLALLLLAFTISCQTKKTDVRQELLKVETDFAKAIMSNDADAIGSYGDSVIVTALTKTKGKFAGNEFTTQDRATDVFIKRNGRWQCVFSQLTEFNKK
jgi:ketosteroid isomerase-like protein